MADKENKDLKSQSSTDSANVPTTGSNIENNQKKSEDLDLDEDLAAALGDASSNGTSEVNFDEVIAEVDPNFKQEIESIDQKDFAGVDIQTDTSDVTVTTENEKVPSALRAYFANLPKDVKVRYLSALGILLVMLPITFLIFKGFLLPTFELPYHVSMKELTEVVYSYPTDTVEVPLFDEFKSQSFTFTLPETTITLKKTDDNPSYGKFEFFLNIREKEMATQIKLKESEIMDLIQRSLEQITWEELQTPNGKEKVKKVIRQRVNEYLQANIVLGVFYRSVILTK
jgi:flagellar basal body-associated protein FliL